jgi:uncharacterized membrane protein YbhN (UPF0104 family)
VFSTEPEAWRPPAPASDAALAPESDPEEPRAPRGGLWRGLLGLAAGLLVAGVAGWALGVKPETVLHYVAGVSPWVLVFCAASGFVVLAFQALRWWAVMKPLLGLRYADAYRAQIVGMMFNAVLPARGGDLLRVQYLGRRTGKSRATILGTELVDRWLDWWGWIPSFVLLCFLDTPPRWLFQALGLFCLVLIAWGTMMVVLLRSKKPASPRLGRIWVSLQAGVGALRSRRFWVIALFLAPLPWLWEALILTQAARGFGIELTLTMAFSVMIGFNLAMIVPSPGAIGTVEVGGTAALIFFGVDQSRALAFMFVYHFTQLLPGIAGGAAVLVAQGERLLGRRRAAEPR